jgi:DedD protein
MESRAKQRLTGAIILVALFVLLVPELLTGPRDTHPDTKPPGDEGLRSYTIELDAQRAASNPMAPAAEPAVALPPVSAPANAGTGRAVPGEAAARAPATGPAQSATNPVAPSSRPSNVITEPAASPTPSPAAPPARPEPVPAKAGSFVVQLGTFGKRENADRLVRDMSAKGFAAFVVPTTSNGHELYRVRVGPTRDRASAEALAAELKRAGQSGSIVPIS